MTLNAVYLYYLIQISSCKSLRVASEKLFVTQPTLTVAIHKLEKQLNTKLLARSSQGVRLTKEGAFVVEQAKLAFNHLDTIEEYFRKELTAPEHLDIKEIVLYLTSETGNKYATSLLKAFYKVNKDTVITLKEYDGHDICDRLLTDKEALGIMCCEANAQFDERLICDVVTKCRAYLMLNKETRLFPPYHDTISLKELSNVPLIIPQAKDGFHYSLLSRIAKYEMPKVLFNSPNYYITERMVQDDSAATLSYAADNEEMDLRYKIISIKNTPQYDLVLLYNEEFSSKKILFLNRIIKECLTS